MDRSLPVVIVNPRSGGGMNPQRWAKVVGPLTEGLGPFDTLFTEAPGDGRRLAAEEAAAGRKLVVAFGGDGTISEVADGLLAAGGDGPALGIIPHGTGGDFRRLLELPDDPGAAGKRVREGSDRRIDVGRVTFTAHDGTTATRHFVNVASFGFSSEVALRANRSSKRLGAKAAFLGATVRSLFTYQNTEIFVSIDGQPKQRLTVLLAAVGNGRFFGGGMKICPEGMLDSGQLDFVAVGDLGRLEVLAKIHRLYAGTHLALPQVQTARLRTLEAAPAEPEAIIPLEIDGETPGRLPARFEVLPGALKLRV